MAEAEKSQQEGQFQAAADLYRRVAALMPHDFDTQYRAAQLALQLERWDEAEGYLRRAIALRPRSGPAHLNRGVVFLKRGDKEEARNELLEAIQLNPALASEAQGDEDFRNLRSAPAFLSLTQPMSADIDANGSR